MQHRDLKIENDKLTLPFFSGESTAELNKVMQGHADGELTEKGMIQSQVGYQIFIILNFIFSCWLTDYPLPNFLK